MELESVFSLENIFSATSATLQNVLNYLTVLSPGPGAVLTQLLTLVPLILLGSLGLLFIVLVAYTIASVIAAQRAAESDAASSFDMHSVLESVVLFAVSLW